MLGQMFRVLKNSWESAYVRISAPRQGKMRKHLSKTRQVSRPAIVTSPPARKTLIGVSWFPLLCQKKRNAMGSAPGFKNARPRRFHLNSVPVRARSRNHESRNGGYSATQLALHVAPRVTEEDRSVLRLLLDKVAHPGMIVVEVGSFLGNGSTRTICEAVRRVGGSFYCVDTWQGNDNVAWHQQLIKTHDLFNTFRHHVASFGGTAVIKPMLMSSLDAARIFADGAADLVFIDGDHAYDGVKHDIEVWKRKVRSGGILCGHDCEGRPSEFGEDRVCVPI